MKAYDEILKKVKNDIRPNDLVLHDVDIFVNKINGLLKKNKVVAKCVKGGSTAKGTFLKGDHDVDLFVIFDYKYKKENLSILLHDALKSLKPSTVHGSRDYFQLKHGKMDYEIIPTLFVKNPNDIENVTDMSPHHVLWVNKKLNDNLRDDIRLTKRFCKALKIYGAESYIQGFSGHTIDILVIYYGGFLKLLNAASKWTPKVVIDIENHWKTPIDNIDASKTFGPLIIVDPVQPQRNAAAAINDEKFNVFIDASKKFLASPSKEFFELNEFDLEKIKKGSKGKVFVALEIEASIGKRDVVGAKLLKIFEHVRKQLILFGFSISDSDWKWDKKKKSEMYFLINEKMLSETFVREGPPLVKARSCEEFKEKNKNYFMKNKRLYANVKRKFRTPEALVKSLIKEDFIKDKANRIRLIWKK